MKILDLGMHPYADSFIGEDQLGLSEPVLPLQVNLEDAGVIQLNYVSDDFDRYNRYAYSYTSSNSVFATDHWDEFYSTVKSRFRLKDALIVEIGSNDGYLASKFLDDTHRIMGIDPSIEMVNLCEKKGVVCYHKFFTNEAAKLVNSNLGGANIVISNNVFNHANDPLDFASGVQSLLADDGIWVFEVPYWKSMIDARKFDQIYHEHVSYFTVFSLLNTLRHVGLDILDFEVVDYHGGSLRVFAKKTTNFISEKVIETIELEKSEGLFKYETYETFQKYISHKRDQFLQMLYSLRIENPAVPIIAIGAAAKANTFLNYYKLDNTIIDFITDSSEYKQGKYTPLTRIPIVSDNIFKNLTKSYALILSWNIAKPLVDKLLAINPYIEFITI